MQYTYQHNNVLSVASHTGAVIDKNSEDISTMFKQETSLLSKASSADVFLDAVTEFVDRNNTQAYTASSE